MVDKSVICNLLGESVEWCLHQRREFTEELKYFLLYIYILGKASERVVQIYVLYVCSSMFYSLSFCSLLHVYNRCHYVSMQAVGVLAVLATGAKLGPF